MSDLKPDCNPTCWTPVKCTACGRRKAPSGRSVPAEAAAGYCTSACIGYWQDPSPGHLWPEERPATPPGPAAVPPKTGDET